MPSEVSGYLQQSPNWSPCFCPDPLQAVSKAAWERLCISSSPKIPGSPICLWGRPKSLQPPPNAARFTPVPFRTSTSFLYRPATPFQPPWLPCCPWHAAGRPITLAGASAPSNLIPEFSAHRLTSFKSLLQCHLLTLFKNAAGTPLLQCSHSPPYPAVLPLVLTPSNPQNIRLIMFTLFLSSLESTLYKGRDICLLFFTVSKTVFGT